RSVTSRGRVALRAAIGPKISLMLYGAAGPYFEVKPFVKVALGHKDFVPGCALTAGVAHEAGGQFDIFGHKGAIEIPLSNFERPLGNGSCNSCKPYTCDD